jgi:hypothetical protein
VICTAISGMLANECEERGSARYVGYVCSAFLRRVPSSPGSFLTSLLNGVEFIHAAKYYITTSI